MFPPHLEKKRVFIELGGEGGNSFVPAGQGSFRPGGGQKKKKNTTRKFLAGRFGRKRFRGSGASH